MQTYPATIANIGDIHVDPYANASTLHPGDLDRAIQKRGIAAVAQNINCGLQGGNLADYDEGRKRFDLYWTGAGTGAVTAVRYELQDMLCNGAGDGDTCDMIVGAVSQLPGILYGDAVTDYFASGFDALRERCQGRGGSAEMVSAMGSDVCGVPTCTADGKMGLKVGTFQAEFYIHDGGDTCPANPPSNEVCKIEPFG